jgi:formiminotetrahydrofolate cyclodeaminase
MAAAIAADADAGAADPHARDAGRARELRRRALALAEAELGSYAPVLEAARLPADDPGRPERLRAALSDAADAPLAIAAVAAEVAELAARLVRTGRRSLEGDATAGALLAEAATRAAVRLVELNLADGPGDGRVATARAHAERAAAARAAALAGRLGYT